ncbi:MAG: hypothetical protein JW749_04715 [Sedimentisphaerales bacterium]|nr:hypothetical protein [Sedimentisphaerales bacterium]
MDLYVDSFVDFKDFALLASGWQSDYNVYDLNSMADEWLIFSGDPNIQIQISGDANDGYIGFGVSNWLSATKRVYLLADGKYVGEIFRFKDSKTLTTDISEYGIGEHQYKMVSADRNGHLTCSNIDYIDFSRPLYYCVLPENYKKNQPLPFAAYNPGDGNFSVNVYAGGGNLVWSQTFSGNTILGSIPSEITADQNDIDYVSFGDVNGQSIAKKVTDPNEPDSSANVQALIVLPSRFLRLYDWKTVAQIQDSFARRNIIYAKLSGKLATYDNVAWYASYMNIKYLYIGCTHGNFYTDKDTPLPLRTNVFLYDGQVVSIKRSDYCDPNYAPPWCEDLSGRDEETLKSFATMGFDSLEFAYFDVCYSGRLKINADDELVEGQAGQQGLWDIPHSDMSFALRMADSSRNHFYQGWYNEAKVKPFPQETDFQMWTQWEWAQLGAGENLYDALAYTIWRQERFGPEDPINNFRLKGMGDLMSVYLRNW